MKRDSGSAGLDHASGPESEVNTLTVSVKGIPGLDRLTFSVEATGVVDDVKREVSSSVWRLSGQWLSTSSFFLTLGGQHVPFSRELSTLPVHESFHFCANA